jgi:hypothetical protein
MTYNSIEKFMFTIVWNPRGFHLIKVLEKDCKFNACYYIAEIFEPLSQSHSIEAASNERKLLVHADNMRLHTANLSTQHFNKNRMKSAPHPPHSPDLAPSDFFSSGMSRDISRPSHSSQKDGPVRITLCLKVNGHFVINDACSGEIDITCFLGYHEKGLTKRLIEGGMVNEYNAFAGSWNWDI